jgi:Cdc6-like AAA superfamily ATPase
MTIKLLEEIEDWKLEAKLENSHRYFYHTQVVDRLSTGKKSYVIGRKGTGKTAISEYLSELSNFDTFAQKLTFKNFPFNSLYEITDSGYTSPNQYITLWKYLIYSTICKLLSTNESLDLESKEKLSSLYDHDLESALPSAISKWTGFKFDLKVLGSGFGVGGNKEKRDDEGLDINKRVEILEKFIKTKIGNEKYLILFDELDEDYKDMLVTESHKKYTELLTSLFKAVQDVRSIFRHKNIFPVVFLRDDIYDILQDPDKSKWTDYKIDLDWNAGSLKNLLAFRISRALDKDSEGLAFAQAWGQIFEGGRIKYGNKDQKSASVFDYITRQTQNRPRDYVRYLQICAELAIEKNKDKVNPDIVKLSSKGFSNYLRAEMEDEIHGGIPEIKLILNLFTKSRKQIMWPDEFKEIYLKEVKSENIPKRDPQFILEMLFMFSVIGNAPRQSSHFIFRYNNKESRLNMNERICIHRGLFRALQIL